MPFVLGVDVGSQSVKAVLVDEAGVTHASSTSTLTMSHPQPGWAEQAPRDWEVALADAVSGVLAQSGVAGHDVAALGLACQVDGAVALTRDLEPLGAAIIWLDRRADDEVDVLLEAVGADRLRSITGLVPDSSHAGPKAMWLRRHRPDAAQAAHFLPAAGYLLARLTGVVAIDHANASSSLLYDLSTRDWAPELLEAAHLEPAALGQVLDSTAVAGTLGERAAAELGLSTSCLVVVGTGDDHAGSLGAGSVVDGLITDVTGTAEPVTVASSRLVVDDGQLVETHAHALPGAFLVENPGFVSGGSTLWLARDVLAVSQGELFDLAARAPAGSGGVTFLPALSGAMTPRWNPRMRGAFTGLAMSHNRADLARAVLEGCAFALRDITDRFAGLGLGAGEIRVVGGGARSALWMQIKADVTGRVVRGVVAREATALGAAMLAGVAAGFFADLPEAADRMVELAPVAFTRSTDVAGLYDDAYAGYRALYDGVEGATT